MEFMTTTITRTFNNKGQLIYAESTSGFEIEFSYDPDHGKVIREIATHFGGLLYEGIFTYNEKYKLVQNHKITCDNKYTTDYYYNTKGVLLFAENKYDIYKFNSNEKLIYEKLSNGLEIWHEYDDKGDKIYTKDSNGCEIWYEYDDKHNLIHHKDSIGRNERISYNDIYEN